MSELLFRYNVISEDGEQAPFTDFQSARAFCQRAWDAELIICIIHAYDEPQRYLDTRLEGPMNPDVGICYGDCTYGCITDALIKRPLENNGFAYVSAYANKILPELFAEAEKAGDHALKPVFVTYDAARNFDRERYCKPPVEVTEERYWEMLEVLPPVQWTRDGGNESFFISEKLTGDLRSCFCKIGKRYFEFTTEKIPHSEVMRIVMASQAWINGGGLDEKSP